MDKFKGMTVHERLYLNGLIKDFDIAVKNKDIKLIIQILSKVELDDTSITPILDSLGLNITKKK
jgi:hypothetical protein